MHVVQSNDGEVDRSSKSEFILRRMVSYFPNRSKNHYNTFNSDFLCVLIEHVRNNNINNVET